MQRSAFFGNVLVSFGLILVMLSLVTFIETAEAACAYCDSTTCNAQPKTNCPGAPPPVCSEGTFCASTGCSCKKTFEGDRCGCST